MSVEAIALHCDESVEIVANAALESGQVFQLPDGRAGVVSGLAPRASGDTVTVDVRGVFEVAKTANITILAGGKVYWDRSADAAHFRAQSGDFYLGVAVKDAAATDTTVVVRINYEPSYAIELPRGQWTNTATNGSGFTSVSGIAAPYKAIWTATAEVNMAALYSVDTVPVADGAIFEAKIAIYDKGDNAALDINFGLANGTHATDFESVTQFVGFHMDGNSLVINAQSRDGTNTTAVATTTVSAVDDTYAEFWIDARDPTSVKLYIDGVRVLSASTFNISAATGPLFPIIHMEKTSDDTVVDVRTEWMRVRSSD